MPARDEMAKSDFLDIMKRMKWGGGGRERERVWGGAVARQIKKQEGDCESLWEQRTPLPFSALENYSGSSVSI